MEKTCKNCTFFCQEKFECRRFPPTNTNFNGFANWQLVSKNDWCGEWKISLKSFKNLKEIYYTTTFSPTKKENKNDF